MSEPDRDSDQSLAGNTIKHGRRSWIVGTLVAVGAAVVGLSWGPAADLFSLLFSRELAASEKVEYLRVFFRSLGGWAPLVYVGLVTLEVVIAPIPGTALYAPGGAVFGGFWGGLLTWIGNVVGAAIACLIARRLRHWLAPSFLEQPAARTLAERIAKRGLLIVFLLRVNPFTSSDLVSYAAGLTPMPLWKVVLGTALGMAPWCWLQAYAADIALSEYPWLVYPLAGAAVLYGLVAVGIVVRLAFFRE